MRARRAMVIAGLENAALWPLLTRRPLSQVCGTTLSHCSSILVGLMHPPFLQVPPSECAVRVKRHLPTLTYRVHFDTTRVALRGSYAVDEYVAMGS